MTNLLEQNVTICRCLQITESMLAEACQRCPLMDLHALARETGAGAGCTSCHAQLRLWIAKQIALSPTASDQEPSTTDERLAAP